MPPGNRFAATCRQCGVEVSPEMLTCPSCEAPRPAQIHFAGEGYEWKSTLTWMGYPMVHIAFGMDAQGHPRTARGLVAVGQRAVGGLAVGVVACGFASIGVLAVGIFSCGVAAAGFLAAAGVNAFAPWAVGVVAFGWVAKGLAAIGWRT